MFYFHVNSANLPFSGMFLSFFSLLDTLTVHKTPKKTTILIDDVTLFSICVMG